jgi:hypothetical protein
MVLTAASMKFRVFWDVSPRIHVEVNRRFSGAYCLHHQVAMMIEEVRTSETSVNFNVATRRYIPEDSKLHLYNFLFNIFGAKYLLDISFGHWIFPSSDVRLRTRALFCPLQSQSLQYLKP